jgi:hypothetical protein
VVPYVLPALEPAEDASKRVILYVLFVANGLATWIGLRLGLGLSVTIFGFLTPDIRG